MAFNFSFLSLLLVSVFLAILLFALTYYLNPKDEDPEKLSAYECGFDPFGQSRSRFDVRFYLVSILFIIFDLEVMFLFPWSVLFVSLGSFALFVVVYFLLILTVGFFYEWASGALDWD